jgi:hypothetical protein
MQAHVPWLPEEVRAGRYQSAMHDRGLYHIQGTLSELRKLLARLVEAAKVRLNQLMKNLVEANDPFFFPQISHLYMAWTQGRALRSQLLLRDREGGNDSEQQQDNRLSLIFVPTADYIVLYLLYSCIVLNIPLYQHEPS